MKLSARGPLHHLEHRKAVLFRTRYSIPCHVA
jgi:hypothetical protein